MPSAEEFSANLIMCVNYQYPGSTVNHQTSAVYKLIYKDPRRPVEDWRDSIGLFSFTKGSRINKLHKRVVIEGARSSSNRHGRFLALG